MTKPKYRPGRTIRTVAAFVRHIEAGGWTYLPVDVRPKHPTVLKMMTLETIMKYARCGRVRRAVLR